MYTLGTDKDDRSVKVSLESIERTVEAASTKSDEALQTAGVATPPSVSIAALDTLGFESELAMWEKVHTSAHTRYKVKSGSLSVGILDVLSDSMGHVVTQILTTHYLLADGTLDTSIHDHVSRPQTYWRTWIKETAKWSEWDKIDRSVINDIAYLNRELSRVKTVVDDNSSHIEDLQELTTEQISKINNLGSDLRTVSENAKAAQDGVDEINDKIGKSGGIASLDANGRVPASMIPAAMDDVKEFDGVEPLDITSFTSAEVSSSDDGCLLYYDPERNTFILRSPSGWHNLWTDAEAFGTPTTNGVTPAADKVYIDRETNKTYRWSGTQLVAIGSDLALGYTASTAFPGNEGKSISSAVKSQAASISKLNTSVSTLETDVSTLELNISALGESLDNIKSSVPENVRFVRFTRIVSGPVDIVLSGADGGPDTVGFEVVYDASRKRFLILDMNTLIYYPTFPGDESYGSQGNVNAPGVIPSESVLYFCIEDGLLYTVKDTTLTPFSKYTPGALRKTFELVKYWENGISEIEIFNRFFAEKWQEMTPGDCLTMNGMKMGIVVSAGIFTCSALYVSTIFIGVNNEGWSTFKTEIDDPEGELTDDQIDSLVDSVLQDETAASSPDISSDSGPIMITAEDTTPSQFLNRLRELSEN